MCEFRKSGEKHVYVQIHTEIFRYYCPYFYTAFFTIGTVVGFFLTEGSVNLPLSLIFTGAVYHFAYFLTSGVLYKVLLITAPLVWIDMGLAASVLGIIAPILFFAATVIIDLLPAFTKAQKVVLTVLPIVSYGLFWIFGLLSEAYFGLK